jgi:hypothetical protein
LNGGCWEKAPHTGHYEAHETNQIIKDKDARPPSVGRDAKLIDWLDELTAECPKKIAHNMNDPCGARCPDLPRVL